MRPARAFSMLRTRAGIILTAACLIYACVHIATIVRSRQVWFDETFFASIAEAFARTGELSLPISPLWIHQHVYLYGPLYFMILATVFTLFGVGIVQTRLPGLLFGFALLGVTYSILRHEKVQRSIAVMACVLLALDPTLHQNVHSGRTDSTSLFFIFSAFLLLLKARDAGGSSGLWWCVGSGILAALGVLTTPRPGYLLIPMGLILLVRWLRRRDARGLLHIIGWGLAFASLYGIWILYAFGSIGGMLGYYAGFADTYAGASQIRLAQAPLLAILFALVLLILVYQPRRLFSELTVFAGFGVAAFYVFVKSGPPFGGLYAFLMIPAAYMALARLISEAGELQIGSVAKRSILYGCFGLLFLINGSAFLARTALELAEWDRRDAAYADGRIGEVVPPGSRVIGDDQFYFAVRRNGSDFQYIERGATLSERVTYHRDAYDFDYLITNQGDDSETVRAYRAAAPMQKVANIAAPPTSRLADAIVAIGRTAGLRDSLLSGYDGQVFARIR